MVPALLEGGGKEKFEKLLLLLLAVDNGGDTCNQKGDDDVVQRLCAIDRCGRFEQRKGALEVEG